MGERMNEQQFSYNGYTGSIEVSLEDNCLYGKILFIQDLVTYRAGSPAELEKAFKEAVDDYIKTCRESGRNPCTFTHPGVKDKLDMAAHILSDVAKELMSYELRMEIGYLSLDEVARKLTEESMRVWMGNTDTLEIPPQDLPEYSKDPDAYLAKRIGVSISDLHLWVENNKKGHANWMSVECAHPDCSCSTTRMIKRLEGMPSGRLYNENEIWYCALHRRDAWRHQGHINRNMVEALVFIANNPATIKTNVLKVGIKQKELDFLESVGLVSVELLANRRNLKKYAISLTHEGLSFLNNKENQNGS